MSYHAIQDGTGLAGLGAFDAFGATADFNATGIWGDCLAGSSGNNAAGKRCGQAIQAGLNQLGYGPLAVDGQIGPASIAAIKKFGQDNGLGSITWPTEAMVIKMQELLGAGATPGPNAPIESHKVGDQYVPGPAPGKPSAVGAKAGMSTGAMIGLGVVVLLGVGALAYASKKKSAGGAAKPSSPAVAAANRRRRARRNPTRIHAPGGWVVVEGNRVIGRYRLKSKAMKKARSRGMGAMVVSRKSWGTA
jgi:peptidoglycan hydrolase-like protein with peptidoglycan-binding domain